MKKFASTLVLLLASCSTQSANNWPSHAQDMVDISLENIKEVQNSLPDWLKSPATQQKFAECLSKRGTYLIEALCSSYDSSKTTKENLKTACSKSQVIKYAINEIQFMCIGEVNH